MSGITFGGQDFVTDSTDANCPVHQIWFCRDIEPLFLYRVAFGIDTIVGKVAVYLKRTVGFGNANCSEIPRATDRFRIAFAVWVGRSIWSGNAT